jgi:hypothetical protein
MLLPGFPSVRPRSPCMGDIVPMALDSPPSWAYRGDVGHRNSLAALRRRRALHLAGQTMEPCPRRPATRRAVEMASAAILLGLLIATPTLAAESSSEESILVFDLAGDDAVVDQHSARMLWNLMTDNIVPESIGIVTVWNSLYLEEPGAAAGQVSADLEAGTITGKIIERWTCSNDCVTKDGASSWTTTRDTGWTATITDGTITPDATGWVISGSVAIKYKTTVTAIEAASDCNGSPCYVCQEQLCKVGGEATAKAALKGRIDGDRLSLSFADQLAADVATMDLSDLLRTEFFMSRFAFTMTGVVPPVVAEPPPEEPAEGEPATGTETPSEAAADAVLPAGQVIPGVDAGSPPGEFGDDSEPEQDAAADKSAAEPTDTDADSSIGSLILAVALLVGVAAAILLARQIIKSGQRRTSIEERALARKAQQAAKDASAWFSGQATHVIEPGHTVWVWNPDIGERAEAIGKEMEGIGPLPLSVQIQPHRADEAGPLLRAIVADGVTVIYDPANPGIAVLRTGAQIWIRPEQLTPLPTDEFAPTHELIGAESIHGQSESVGRAYLPGTPVQVITTTGDKTLVRVDAKTRMWVPRRRSGARAKSW